MLNEFWFREIEEEDISNIWFQQDGARFYTAEADVDFGKKKKKSSFWSYIYTYIIGHYNPSVRIIDLVSKTTNVVCINFIHKWWDLQFKVDSERKIF